MEKANKTFFYLLSGVLTLIVIIFFISVEKQTPPSQIKPTGLPIVTSTLPGSKEFNESSKKIQSTVAPQLKRDSLVGELLGKVPYSGKYFKFYFDYPTARFILELDSNHVNEGNKNFDAFLKKNNVEERSWIKNLGIKYIDFSKEQVSQPT